MSRKRQNNEKLPTTSKRKRNTSEDHEVCNLLCNFKSTRSIVSIVL